MNASTLGMIAGILIAIASLIYGFFGFLLAVVFGALGFAIAGQISGQFDLRAAFSGRGRG